MRYSLITNLLALTLFLSSCSVGPDYVRPEDSISTEFRNSASKESVELKKWWEGFQDPILNQLIEESITSNLSFREAQARVKEARALYIGSRSSFFPIPNLTTSYSRTKGSENAIGAQSGGSGNNNGFQAIEERNLYQAGFDATWEIDIFGGIRREVESAKSQYEAQIESSRDVLISLLGEVAQSYLNLRSAQTRLNITLENIKSEEETLDIQKTRQSVGIASDLTVAQSEAQLKSISAQLPALEIPIQQSIHRLSVLLGKEPNALYEQLKNPTNIIKGPINVPSGLPSDLLKRRPDIRQAERLLQAATAEIGVAVSDFFPKLQITGNIGFRSENTSNLISSGSKYWAVGPNISWGILNWYAILANIDIQNARQEQALLTYKQIVLESLEEVENNLFAYNREQERTRILKESVDASQRALDHAKVLYSSGVLDFLNVLNSQRTLYQAQDTHAQSQQTSAAYLIALYKSLGGGWESIEEKMQQD